MFAGFLAYAQIDSRFVSNDTKSLRKDANFDGLKTIINIISRFWQYCGLCNFACTACGL